MKCANSPRRLTSSFFVPVGVLLCLTLFQNEQEFNKKTKDFAKVTAAKEKWWWLFLLLLLPATIGVKLLFTDLGKMSW